MANTPWKYHEQGEANHYCIMGPNNEWIVALIHNGGPGLTEQRDHMRRIVAAVNASAEISTETLERISLPTNAINMLMESAEIEKQRAKLLAAAKMAVRVIAEERAGGSTESKRLMQQAQAMLFSAISEVDPAYYGKNSDLVEAK
jgi:hypothetical protein